MLATTLFLSLHKYYMIGPEDIVENEIELYFGRSDTDKQRNTYWVIRYIKGREEGAMGTDSTQISLRSKRQLPLETWNLN